MDLLSEAFRRAQRAARALSIEEAFGPIFKLPGAVVAGHLGPWEDQLVAQALIVLRRRGVPEPVRGPNIAFQRVIDCVLSCQEIVADDHPHPEAGRKPAA